MILMVIASSGSWWCVVIVAATVTIVIVVTVRLAAATGSPWIRVILNTKRNIRVYQINKYTIGWCVRSLLTILVSTIASKCIGTASFFLEEFGNWNLYSTRWFNSHWVQFACCQFQSRCFRLVWISFVAVAARVTLLRHVVWSGAGGNKVVVRSEALGTLVRRAVIFSDGESSDELCERS